MSHWEESRLQISSKGIGLLAFFFARLTRGLVTVHLQRFLAADVG